MGTHTLYNGALHGRPDQSNLRLWRGMDERDFVPSNLGIRLKDRQGKFGKPGQPHVGSQGQGRFMGRVGIRNMSRSKYHTTTGTVGHSAISSRARPTASKKLKQHHEKVPHAGTIFAGKSPRAPQRQPGFKKGKARSLEVVIVKKQFLAREARISLVVAGKKGRQLFGRSIDIGCRRTRGGTDNMATNGF